MYGVGASEEVGVGCWSTFASRACFSQFVPYLCGCAYGDFTAPAEGAIGLAGVAITPLVAGAGFFCRAAGEALGELAEIVDAFVLVLSDAGDDVFLSKCLVGVAAAEADAADVITPAAGLAAAGVPSIVLLLGTRRAEEAPPCDALVGSAADAPVWPVGDDVLVVTTREAGPLAFGESITGLSEKSKKPKEVQKKN